MALVKYNNRSILNVTALDSIASGDMNLITTNTISSGVSSSSFTSSIDSTYDTYIFKYINMHPATDNTELQFQVSINGGSSYGVAITSTAFQGYHYESGGSQGVAYYTADDLAQSTNFQQIFRDLGAANDESCSGTLHLFDPSNTTFVKHFISRIQGNNFNNYTEVAHVAGYVNTTAAITAVQFKIDGENIASGTIKMYGVV